MVAARPALFIALLIACLGLPSIAVATSAEDRQLEILGWIERVRLAPGDLAIRAKLDTGADHSSLNAPDPEEFERDDQTWVRFTVENEDGVAQEFEKPVERMVRIRSASGVGRRYVVRMNICLGNILREVEVNLADRSELSYQMLIGRSYMTDHILVDSGREHTVDPDCDMDAVPQKHKGGKNGRQSDTEIEDDYGEEEVE
ncbi:MAG: ATP-dependent zinc protease [Aquisalimonadaceae bacterium]